MCRAIAETCLISIFLTSLFFFFFPLVLRHRPGLDLGHAKGILHLTFAMTQRVLWSLYYFMGTRAHSQVAVISEPEGFRAGDQAGKLGLILAVIAVISGMTGSHGCVR